MKNKEPKIKADDFVEYEGIEEPAKFTNFEELQKRVEILQEMVNLHAEIISQNNLTKIEQVEANEFDEDDVYKRLEADE